MMTTAQTTLTASIADLTTTAVMTAIRMGEGTMSVMVDLVGNPIEISITASTTTSGIKFYSSDTCF